MSYNLSQKCDRWLPTIHLSFFLHLKLTGMWLCAPQMPCVAGRFYPPDCIHRL